MDISIKGVQKTSLIDYPKKVASVIFVSRCNFRCPYCHNPELALDQVKDGIDAAEVLDFLEKKKKWIDGVCITGGEPTLHKGLPEFAAAVKRLGLKVKIDTNGTNPDMLKQMIGDKLVDYIAMDIKAHPDDYRKATNVKADTDAVRESAKIIMDSGLPYEFRTTVVPGLFDESDAEKIGKWLKGAKKFCIQQFRNSDKLLDPAFQNVGHYHAEKLFKFRDILAKHIKGVEVRGV